MEPIPETVEAAKDFGPSTGGHGGLLADLMRMASQGQEIVPDLVGLSLARFDRGLTFTLVASAGDFAVLDAIQYLAGGPCVEAAQSDQVISFEPGVLHEEQWRLFAEGTAARAVRSTLTLPVMAEGRVIGSVNLYGASRRAFGGHHEQLADLFGAWAAGAVANADLSFTTREEAGRAPQRIRDHNLIDTATSMLAELLGVDVETARARLGDAASRGGVSLLQLARAIVTARQQDPDVE